MDNKLDIIIVDPDPHYRLAVRQQVSKIPEAELVGEAEGHSATLELLRKTQADLVILELPKNPEHVLALVEKWRVEFPHLLLYASSASKNPDLILSAMRAGISEYLSKPLEIPEFWQAIEKAVRQLKTEAQRSGQTGTVTGVYSKKGGQGVTTIAVNLAVALGQAEDKRTAIVDMNFDQGDVACLIDVHPEFTIGDLLDKNSAIDQGKLLSCLIRHRSGIYYFGERENTGDSELIAPDQVRKMISYLRDSFQNVILDLPHSFDAHTYEAFEMADTILLVATADLSSIRSTRYTLRVLRSLGYDDTKVKIVLNRVSKRDAISVAQFEETVERAVVWKIPNNYTRVIESINTGEPVVATQRKSDIGKSLLAMAEQFANSNNGSEDKGAAQKSRFKSSLERK